jgi:F420-non-reducing hydrogenase iron-sulfur subunit
MVIDFRTQLPDASVSTRPAYKLTVFYCFNALNGVSLPEIPGCEIKAVKLPCSGLTREVVLLRAFEAGADAVLVLVCPEGSCHYLQGNYRATKRVERMKRLLDVIGLDGRRLEIYNVPRDDQPAVDRIIEQTVSSLVQIGTNPAGWK